MTAKLKCTGCGEWCPCTIEVHRNLKIVGLVFNKSIGCVLDKTNVTEPNWSEVEEESKSKERVKEYEISAEEGIDGCSLCVHLEDNSDTSPCNSCNLNYNEYYKK